MTDLTNRHLIFCPPCAARGDVAVLRLESVGFLSRLRAASYVCERCGEPTAVSVRQGSLRAPRSGCCWSCGSAIAGGPEICPSCDAHTDPAAGHADGVLYTFTADESQALLKVPVAELGERLDSARRERRLTDALAAADALTRVAAEEPAAWRRKASLYLEHGFLALALAATKRALLLAPDAIDIRLELANIVELLDELDGALALLLDVIDRAPEDPRPHASAAALLEKLERFDEARAAATRAVELDPTRADGWATLATLHMRSKEFEAAAAAWDRVLEVSLDFPLAWRYKGMCHLYARDWSAAVAAGLRAGDDDDEALELVFEAQLGGGELDAALTQAERLVALHPDDSRFLYLVARARLARDELDDGLAVMDRIVELEPKAGWAKRARGVFVERLGGRDAG